MAGYNPHIPTSAKTLGSDTARGHCRREAEEKREEAEDSDAEKGCGEVSERVGEEAEPGGEGGCGEGEADEAE